MAKSSFGLRFMQACFVLKVLIKHQRMDLDQINDLWVEYPHGDGERMSTKTFGACRNSIGDIFGIDVQMNRTGKGECTYAIINPEDLENNKVLDWSFAAFAMGETLLDAKPLHSRIVLDGFPSENGWLVCILDAMKRKRKLRIVYQSYNCPEPKVHVVEPYCTKQYKLRLYLIGLTKWGNLCPFALDRILSLEILEQIFDLPIDFDAEDYFKNAYGVMVDDIKWPPETVRLRAFKDEPNYLRDVPMHKSQVELPGGKGYTDFEYYISCTNDFIGHILERGDRIRVISPQWLADEIRHRLKETADRYDGPMKE